MQVGLLLTDLGLFSSRSLVLAHPDHRVEIRTQLQQSPNDDVENNGWHCESSRSHTTIAKYAEYQVTSYIETQGVSSHHWMCIGPSSLKS